MNYKTLMKGSLAAIGLSLALGSSAGYDTMSCVLSEESKTYVQILRGGKPLYGVESCIQNDNALPVYAGLTSLILAETGLLGTGLSIYLSNRKKNNRRKQNE